MKAAGGGRGEGGWGGTLNVSMDGCADPTAEQIAYCLHGEELTGLSPLICKPTQVCVLCWFPRTHLAPNELPDMGLGQRH